MLDAAPVRVRTWLETWLREQATRDFAVSPSPTDADAPAQPVGRSSSRASSEATGGHPSPTLRAPSPVGRERGGAGRPSASTQPQPEAWAARAPSPIGWERAGVRVRASAAAILPPVTPQTIAELETGHRELQALIDQIPDEATVTPLIATRDEHLRALERARLRLEDLEAQARQVQPLLERAQARVAQLEEQRQRAARAQDQTQRLHHAATTSAEVLAGFRRKLIERTLDEIARRTQENFATLLHKTDLFDRVRLRCSEKGKDLKFFLELELAGQPRDPYRFSAGERQMLALSLLWAFAQTSQWRTPVIIDTPLARLDQAHRQNVVNHYMPAAGAQVIVLATDAERSYFDASSTVARRIGLGVSRRSGASLPAR